MSKSYGNFEATFLPMHRFFSCFRESCLFELSQTTVSPDLDHSPGLKHVWLFLQSLKNGHPDLVSQAQAAPEA